MTDAKFWQGRWERGEIGWHQTEVEPALVAWYSARPRGRIFVPLCGKSLDLKWLLDEGHDVVGCERSSTACEAFFREHEIVPDVTPDGPFQIYRAPSITLFGGDFFDLTADQLGEVDAVYDRAALIALPPDVQPNYARHLLGLLALSLRNPRFEFRQLVLERTPADPTGPPFSTSPETVALYYGNALRVELRSREAVDARAPEGSQTVECVIDMKPLSSG